MPHPRRAAAFIPTVGPTAGPTAALAAVLAAVLTATAPGVLAGQEPAASPCGADAYRQFDFWVGEWEVYRPDGSLAGRNTIRRVMGGCVLHESYESATADYEGQSFNTWDAARGIWHQTWVDNGGLLLRIEGGLRADGAMVMEGTTVGADGAETLNRITWSTVDGDPDRVRQLWETSGDGGAAWEVVFDGEYRRVEEASGGRGHGPLRPHPPASIRRW